MKKGRRSKAKAHPDTARRLRLQLGFFGKDSKTRPAGNQTAQRALTRRDFLP